jgi:hypothetical protein
MKKLTIIGLSVAMLVVVCALMYRWHIKTAEFDQDFHQNLAGTWSAALDNMRLTNIVMPDGSFNEQSAFIHTDRINRYQRTGTWLVQGGRLIETVKSDSNPTAVVMPRSHSGKIIHSDTNEFVVNWQGSPDVWVWQRITQ